MHYRLINGRILKGLVDQANEVEISDTEPTDVNKKLFIDTNEEPEGDFVYIGDIIDNLESTSTTDALSANQGRILNEKIDNLSNNYTGTNVAASTCEGFGKIKKLYGKTEEIGEGEKSVDNPYEISCIADDVNLFDVNDMPQGTYNGITCTLEDNILTFNGTCTHNNTAFVAVLKDTISNIKGKTNVFIEYISGTLTNQTDTTTYSFFDTDYTHNIYEKLRFENMQSISNYDDNFNFHGFQFRFDNNVVANNYKVRVKISQKVTQTWSEYGHGETKITSTDGTNTSNKVITCKPLCYLKDSEGNIIAQDYIDFDRQKIHRECKPLILNGSENWYAGTPLTNCVRLYTPLANLGVAQYHRSAICSHLKHINNWNLDEPQLYTDDRLLFVFIPKTIVSTVDELKNWLQTNPITFIFKISAVEEDIDITNSIVQYQNQTTISNSDGAEMEIELTKNKTISSINENIEALQERDNKVKEILSADWITPQMLNDWKNASGLFNSCQYKKIGNTVYIRGSITKNRVFSSNEDRIVFYLPEGYRPKKNYAGTINGCPYNIHPDGLVAIGNLTEFKADDWCCFDGLTIFID